MLSRLMLLGKRYFEVAHVFLDRERGVLYFEVAKSDDLGEKFSGYLSELERAGYIAVMKDAGSVARIHVLPFVKRPRRPGRDIMITAASLAATLLTVGLSGYIFGRGDLVVMTTYVISMISIIFFHEMGHYVLSRISGLDVSTPIFLPGLPQVGGTFGALIRMRGPPKTRRQMLLIGFSGPLAGFITALVVSIVGLSWSRVVEISEIGESAMPLPSPPIFYPLIHLVHGDLGPGKVVLLHPVALAGWVGMLITFLNLTPIGQLDGGHIFRAVLSDRAFKALSYLFIFLLFLMGWVFMAIFALFVINNPGPLDDVTRPDKKMLVIPALALAIWLLTATQLTFF